MSDIAERVLRSAEQNGLRGARVAVAVSGGGDSVALFWLLVRIAPVLHLRLHLVHVDHGWREGGLREAEFCRRIADRASVGSTVVRLPKPMRRSEESARAGRHEALRHVARALGAAAVALGHQLDDQAETALMQVLRGTSAAVGMAEWQPPLWRPLLGVRRADLRGWLAGRGEAHLDDPTNGQGEFLRNRLRLRVLPLLELENPRAGAALARLASFAREDDEELARLGREALAACRLLPGGIALGRLVREQPAAVARRALREVMRSRGAEPDARMIAEGIDALRNGARRTLRAGLWVESGALWWGAQAPPAAVVPQGGRVRYGRLWVGDGDPPPGALVRALSGRGEISVRRRLAGDRIRVGAGHRKLQDVLVDGKMVRPLRDHLPVVTLAGEPVWLPGAPLADVEPQDGPMRTVWVAPALVVTSLWGVLE